jgi:osmotically inducible protein OsmC
MDRKATAVWQGDLRHGKGTLTTESKALSAPYSFSTRFEGTPGTNPEELLGAAHAGCFTMALTHSLGEAGIKPERIETQATVTLERLEAGFTITKVHLDVSVKAPGADRCESRGVGAECESQLPAQPRAEGRDLDGGTARRLRC